MRGMSTYLPDWLRPWFAEVAIVLQVLLIPMRRVRAMRLRATSTSSTLTLTMSPALTTSRGSLT
jgi:hypothetical protein